MSDQEKYPPGQVLQTMWEKRKFSVFSNALWRYYEVLSKHRRPGNTTIGEELKKIQTLRAYIRKSSSADDYMPSFRLEAQDFGFLLNVLWKYYSAKKQELEEAKRTTLIESANEHLEKEVELINEILQAALWERVERSKILVDSLYVSREEPKDPATPIHVQTTIGTVFGQVIGVNQGQATQNQSAGPLQLLQKLYEEVSSNKEIPNTIKSDAIGDIQTMQSQLMKTTPDKSILSKARDALSILADATQVGGLAKAAGPLLAELADKLPI